MTEMRWAVSEWVIACTSPKRWFDLDAVRTDLTRPEFAKYEPITNRVGPGRAEDGAKRSSRGSVEAGAPPLDHSWLDWDDDPAALITMFIRAMCPMQVCTICGEPRRRIVGKSDGYAAFTDRRPTIKSADVAVDRQRIIPHESGFTAEYETLGWTDCGHDSYRNGRILDPFHYIAERTTNESELMSNARVLLGDVRERMAEIPDKSIDLIGSSPPYLALRSYLPADHPDKNKEIGSEPDPATFIDVMLGLTAEWRRILTPTGSLVIELGDTYSGSGGGGGDYKADGLKAGQAKVDGSQRRTRPVKASKNSPEWAAKYGAATDGDRGTGVVAVSGGPGWPLAKSRTLVPELYRVALAYGINPLTGQPSPAGRWRVRQVHYHCRPNPPVGALGDKFRPSVSEWVIACTSAKRWFDLDAVRTEGSDNTHARGPGSNGFARVAPEHVTGSRNDDGQHTYNIGNPAGAPPLDHSWLAWDDWFPAAQRTPTTPYPGAHYATFGAQVIRPFIEAMCPMQVCVECGEPRRRIVKPSEEYAGRPFAGVDFCADAEDTAATGQTERNGWRGTATYETLGWTDCGCRCGKCKACVPPFGERWPCTDHYRNGVVLDPFCGSGTTLEVATGCGRDAIGIDLDNRNLDLIRQRVGMFLGDIT